MITFALVKGILAALITLRILYAILTSILSPLRKVPGPLAARFTKLWFFARVAKGDFHHENIDLHRRYGPLVRLAPDFVSLDDPSAVKHIYKIGSRFPKSDWYQAFKSPDPKIFTIFTDQDIKRHAESRRLLQSVYSMSSMVNYEHFVDQCADLLAQHLREAADGRRNLDMAHWFQAYAFDVVASVTFGSRFGFLDRGEDIRGMMGELHEVMRYSSLAGIFPRLHAWIFYPSARLGLFGSRGRVAHMEFVRRRMAVRAEERRLRDYAANPKAQAGQAGEAGEATRDFMDRLWDKHDENPDRLTQHHIFMVGLANITAGSDTTSTTLSGMLYCLLTHPRVLARLEREIDEATAAGQLSDRPTFREAQQMRYLDAVVKESLRFHSAVGLPLWRVVPEGGVEAAGRFLPAGTNVGVNPWVAHRNQEVWGADADEFRPERWLEAKAERLQRMEAYHISFGLGARTCIGRHISILEMTKLVPRLLRDFEFELVRPEDGMKCDDILFVLPRNLWVSVRRREKP